jgi:hypothetical protein
MTKERIEKVLKAGGNVVFGIKRIDDILLKVIFNYSGGSFSYTYLKFYLYIVSDYSGTNYFST